MIWVLLACLVAGVFTHDLLKGERLILDLFREVAIARADLAALDARWRERRDRSAIVVSITTTPSRLPMIADTLKSLLMQTRPPARIVLNVPWRCRRDGAEYVIPEILERLSSIEIARTEDLGPATKLLPTLARSSPDQAIAVTDDDRLYPPDFIAGLERAAAREPDVAFAYSGWRAPDDLVDRPTTLLSNLFERAPTPLRAPRQRAPVPIDIMQGYAGYLVRPRFFELSALNDYSTAPECAWSVDDVWISAHCQAPKWLLPASRTCCQAKRRMRFYHDNSLGLINRGDGSLASRPNTIMLRHFRERWRR